MMIDFDIQEELNSALSPGEKLVWTGRPRKGIVLRGSDVFLIPFSLFWAGFAIFWETMVLRSGVWFMALFGIPFICIGIYITIGRFFLDARRRANTVYGITEGRIIIKSGLFNKGINSLNLRTLSDITFTQKAGGSGTIILGAVNARYARMQGMAWPGVVQTPSLELIDDVKQVYDKIIELQRK
jgi:hypothetical protein